MPVNKAWSEPEQVNWKLETRFQLRAHFKVATHFSSAETSELLCSRSPEHPDPSGASLVWHWGCHQHHQCRRVCVGNTEHTALMAHPRPYRQSGNFRKQTWFFACLPNDIFAVKISFFPIHKKKNNKNRKCNIGTNIFLQHQHSCTAPTLLHLHSPWGSRRSSRNSPQVGSARHPRVFDGQDGNCHFVFGLLLHWSTHSNHSNNKCWCSSSRKRTRSMREQHCCAGPTLMTSSSDELHSTDSTRSVTVPSSSTETTLTGTATVFPVRIAVFRISASWGKENKRPLHI